MKLGHNKLPWYGQALAFVAVVALMYGSFHFYWVVPTQERIALYQGEIDGLRAEIALAQAIANRLPEFAAEVAELEAWLETLRTVSPR